MTHQPEPPDPLFAGKFRMQKMLGRGAMGEVWLAVEEGPRNFQRLVAVKRLLATEGMSDIARQSFVAEAQALAHLDHPNIVRLIELGETDDRGLYLVLDYVDGAALDKIIRKTGALSPAAVALIGREVAKALDAVHSLSDAQGQNLGVVHRDVSPANILIGKDGRIRLSDFGVARITGLGGEKTETGVFKGKLPYMPPEQALGEPFDGRADLFSLGITIFEALIGGRLRKAETQGQLIARIATERAPLVAERAPDTPAFLARAIDATTEFNAELRTRSAGEVALALHQVLYQLGPHAEQDAVNEICERIAVVTDSAAAPGSRAPWSLALSSENPAFGSAQSYPSGPPSYHSSPSSVGRRPGLMALEVTGPHTPISIHPSASTMHVPSSVTHISSITDARTNEAPRSRPWLWVVGAALAGGAMAIGIWFFLEHSRAGETASSGSSEPVSSAPQGTEPAKTIATTSSTTPPLVLSATTTTEPSASSSSGPHVPHGTLPPVRTAVPIPTDSTAEDPDSPGSIQVVVNPWGNVSIDGRSVGTTPMGPVSVPPGNHVVTVTNSDLGATRSQGVKVTAGKSTGVRFDLKKSE